MRTRFIPLCALLAALASGSAADAVAQALPKGVIAPPVQVDSGISSNWALLDDSAFSVARGESHFY